MKRLIIPLLLLLSAIIASATVPATSPWTLDSCINYARINNLTVKSRRLDLESSKLAVDEGRSRFLPELNASASQTFNFGRGLTSENTYANRNTSQFGWNVGLSLPLFQGLSAWRNLKLQRANLTAMAMQVNAAESDITVRVIAQYLQVLYADELTNVARKQIDLSVSQLERQQSLFEAGKIAELDVTQAKAQLAQDELALVNAENDHRMALLDLAQLLQLSDTNNFNIAPLDDYEVLLPSDTEVSKNALQGNAAVRAAELNIEAADKNIELARTGYIPRLSFNAGLGSSYYKLAGFDNAPFHRQMRDNFNKYVGFSLQIPIFDALSTHNNVKRARLQKLQAQLQADQTRSELSNAISQAYTQATGAREKMEAAKVSAEAANVAFDAMSTKYYYGKANATEYEQASNNLLKARIELTQAKYEWLLRVRILDFYNTATY